MSSSSDLITITIQNPYLPDYHYQAKLQSDSTILSLKQYLSSHYAPSTSPSHCHPSITSQRLVCAGRLVADHELIGEIGKQQSSNASSSSVVLHLLIKPQENVTSTPTIVATSSDVPTSTPLTSTPVASTSTSTSASTSTSTSSSSSPTYTPEQIATYYQQLATYQHAYLQYLQSMYPYYHPYPYGMIPPTMGLRQRHTGQTTEIGMSSNERNETAHPFLEQYHQYLQQQQQQQQAQPQPQPQPQPPHQAPVHQPEPAAAPAAAGVQQAEPAARPQPAYMRYIDIKLIGKMAMLMMLFGQDGDIHRLSILFILCVFAYLYQVGVLRRNGAIPPPMGDDEDEDEVMAQQGGFGAAGGGGAGGQRREEIPEPVAVDPNVVDPAAPPRPTGMLVNIEKFIVGFFASLVPTWNPPPP